MSKYKAENFIASLKFAIRGLLLSIKSQRNFRVDLTVGVLAIITALVINLSALKIAVLIITIGVVLIAEMFNTVIEFVVDAYFGHKYSILAKMAKDISAGAVLVSAIMAIIVGLILFLEPVI